MNATNVAGFFRVLSISFRKFNTMTWMPSPPFFNGFLLIFMAIEMVHF